MKLLNKFVRKICAWAVLSALLTGCAASGPAYVERQDPIPESVGELVVYLTRGPSVHLKLDGNLIGQLRRKGFIAYQGLPGKYQLSASDYPGYIGTPSSLTTDIEIELVKGRQTFAQLRHWSVEETYLAACLEDKKHIYICEQKNFLPELSVMPTQEALEDLKTLRNSIGER